MSRVDALKGVKSAIASKYGDSKDKMTSANEKLANFMKTAPARLQDDLEEVLIKKAIKEEELVEYEKSLGVSPNKVKLAQLELRKAETNLKDAVDTCINACYTSMSNAVESGDIQLFTNLLNLAYDLEAGNYEGKYSVSAELKAVESAKSRLEVLQNPASQSGRINRLKAEIETAELRIKALQNALATLAPSSSGTSS